MIISQGVRNRERDKQTDRHRRNAQTSTGSSVNNDTYPTYNSNIFYNNILMYYEPVCYNKLKLIL